MENQKKERAFQKIYLRCMRICAFLITLFVVSLGYGKAYHQGDIAEAASKELSGITAVYTGEGVLIGHSIDLTKLTVMGVYQDGSYSKISDYTLSSYIVEKIGSNQITVSAEGKSSVFIITGKKITNLIAYYQETGATVGEQIQKEKITVSAYFSDGSSKRIDDYIINTRLVSSVGENVFFVTYENTTATFKVTGREEKKVKELIATYIGENVIVGNTPVREKILVTAIYNNNSVEKITGFELSPTIVQKSGTNLMVVSYGGQSAEIKVTGIAKKVVSVKAEYKGFPVVIGKTVSPEDIEVTATYNDGKSEKVKNFTLSSSVIYTLGNNVITIHCENATGYIFVRGVEAEIIDYSKAAEETIKDENFSSKVVLAVGEKADPKKVIISNVDAALVRKAMRRTVRSDRYLAFEVSFDDPELDRFLPMTMKVTVPLGYSRENFKVLYTPNRKTIMASMNGEYLKDGTYEFKMFQPGTYIIADCTERVYVETIELENTELTLKAGRSTSLKPAIFPLAATNKEVTYVSSRPQIATVSEDGLVTAVAPGATVITVSAADGSGVTSKLMVYVKNSK